MIPIGKQVIKNKDTWIPNDFDNWGRGVGVGTVVKAPFKLDSDVVDIKWENGRSFENIIQLIVIT